MKKEKTAKTEKNEKHWERVTQEFAPVCDADCRVLILGTAPSKKSREVGFYYGHPQNRFWKMLAAVTGERVPQSIAEKKALLLRNHIALHDVIHSCDIIGSSDSSIKNVEPADDVQQRGLTAAGLAENCNKLILAEGNVDALERLDLCRSGLVYLGDVFQFQHGWNAPLYGCRVSQRPFYRLNKYRLL